LFISFFFFILKNKLNVKSNFKNNQKEDKMVENEFEKKFKEVTGKNFNLYFKEYNPKLIWYLTKSFTKNEDKSKEYSQKAFMQALEKIEIYKPEMSALHTWITKIAMNLVIKDWKDAQKIEIVSVDAEIQDTPGFINIIPDDNGEQEKEEHLDNVKKCEIIIETIKTLPEKYKKVMVMREIQNMHYKDISDKIRKNEKVVVKNKTYRLLTPEDFYSLDLENVGQSPVHILFTNGDKSFTRVIRPYQSFCVVRDEIEWDRSPEDEFSIISSDSECNISYVTTTNLSTIKSQIKKGRSLIKKKIKRKFDLLGFTIPKSKEEAMM
jgi:RNA polymerase sigma-70 factor (ECF subfamily)